MCKEGGRIRCQCWGRGSLAAYFMSDGGGIVVGLYILEVKVVGWVERVPFIQFYEDGLEQISVSSVRC